MKNANPGNGIPYMAFKHITLNITPVPVARRLCNRNQVVTRLYYSPARRASHWYANTKSVSIK